MRKLFGILLLVLSFLEPVSAQETTYKTIQNIAYYPENTDGATEYRNKQCRLDVYYPEGKKEVPVILWFHGGGLTGGGKDNHMMYISGIPHHKVASDQIIEEVVTLVEKKSQEFKSN